MQYPTNRKYRKKNQKEGYYKRNELRIIFKTKRYKLLD